MSEEALERGRPLVDIGASEIRLAGLGIKYRHYALALLTTVYVVNYLDRQILSILLQPIKEHFGVSDTALGFMYGATFAIFYATLGIPIAMIADRVNRRNVIAASMALFSVMTVACGLVAQFWQLVLARIGVGVGEAGTSPPSHSLIADLYPPEKRATAMAIFSSAINIGMLIAFLAGGWVTEAFGWRVAFMFAGAPGIALTLLVVLTLKEPHRGHADALTREEGAKVPGILEVFGFMWSQKSWRWLCLATTFNAFVGYGLIGFTPAYLVRSQGLSTGEAGTFLAITIGALGGIGVFLGGILTDRLAARDIRWNAWVPAWSVVAGIVPAAAFWLAPNPTFAFVAFLIPAFVGTVYLAPVFSMTQALVPVSMRAVAAAVLLFILNIIALGLGPQTVGILSDVYAAHFGLGNESLRYALLTCAAIYVPVAIMFFLAAPALKDDVARARAQSEATRSRAA